MTFRKYLLLAAIVLFGAFGDFMLSRGMKDVGTVSLANWSTVLTALLNPWVAAGTLLLIGFLAAYTSSLSWADLTYVLPATALGYVLIALLAQFGLGERVTPMRWLGILLITVGVGFVAGGPAYTTKDQRREIAQGKRQFAAEAKE